MSTFIGMMLTMVTCHSAHVTVIPTRYVVFHDSLIKPDNLKKLTFKLTLNYFDSFVPVSVPAPCLVFVIDSLFLCLDLIFFLQYAEKLAYLVGKHIRKDVKEELCDRLFFL